MNVKNEFASLDYDAVADGKSFDFFSLNLHRMIFAFINKVVNK